MTIVATSTPVQPRGPSFVMPLLLRCGIARVAAGGTRQGLMLGRSVAALRLRCGARPGVAPHNSLRSLRSLRSDRCGESDHEARCARRPQACAPRRPRNRPCRVPPAAKATMRGVPANDKPRCIGKGAGGQPAARLCAAEKRRARGRARSALRELTRRVCPSAVSAANVASYATGPRDRASQGTLAQRGQATKRCRRPARAFARADARMQSYDNALMLPHSGP